MGLTSALNAAMSGLRVTQAGLDIVSTNVSNAGSAGYVRRTATAVEQVAGNQSAGVRSGPTQRMLDVLIQRQLRSETSGAGYTGVRADAYKAIDQMFGVPGGANALDTKVNAFSSALSALEADPGSTAARADVVNKAQALATSLASMSQSVQEMRRGADAAIGSGVARANDLLGQLERVNRDLIGQPEGETPPALLDQRDRILNDLSRLIDIRVTEDRNGGVTVATTSGVTLFDGQSASRLAFEESASIGPASAYSTNPATSTLGTIRVLTGAGAGIDLLAGGLRSGELAAQVELRDRSLVQIQNQLDQVAAGLATGTQTTVGVTSLNLFSDGAIPTDLYTGAPGQLSGFSQRIRVNATIASDPSRLVTYAPGIAAGDPAMPSALIAQFNTNQTFSLANGVNGTSGPFTGSIASFTRRVVEAQGTAAAAAASLDEGQSVALSTVQGRFAENSAVNVDQEMTTLIQLQSAYSANARVITAVKEMMDLLLRI